ncbi:CHAP domain-containing protein [Staphylococcus aureus]
MDKRKAIKSIVHIVKNYSKYKFLILTSIVLLLILAFTIMILTIALFVSSDESLDGYSINGKCSVVGTGKVSKKGIETFNKHAKGGALENKAEDIVKIAEQEKVPPRLFLAIIASESEWGKGANATKQNNPLSVMGNKSIEDSKFNTIDEGLKAGAKNLYDVYIKEGLDTPEKIGPKYAPIGASNDPTDLNSNWVPTVKKIMESIDGENGKSGSCNTNNGKDMSFDGLPSWSNSNPGKNNLYTAGQCTWYAYGIRQKMGHPVSTYWGDAHNWNDRAKAEGYKVDSKPKKGALFIAEQGAGGHDSYYGHVAIVIGVSSDGKKFKISEMNWEGAYKVNQRELKMTEGYSFIHDK